MVVKTAYVEDSAREYDARRFATPAGRAIHAVEWRLISEALAKCKPGSRVLDVGCGSGRFLLATRALGLACEGVDASPDMLEVVRDKLGPDAAHVPLALGEGRSLPYEDGLFDLAYSIRVLNQTGTSEYALAMVGEILRVVRPGGLALIEFANRARPKLGAWHGVRLRPAEVIAAAHAARGTLEAARGAFQLGMVAQHRCPAALRPLLCAADDALCRLAPRLCARVYLHFRKAA